MKLNKLFKSERKSCAAEVDCVGNMTGEGLRRGAGRRELRKRGRGMKDRVDNKIMIGLATLIAETLAKMNQSSVSCFFIPL